MADHIGKKKKSLATNMMVVGTHMVYADAVLVVD